MLNWFFDWIITPAYLLTPLMAIKGLIELYILAKIIDYLF